MTLLKKCHGPFCKQGKQKLSDKLNLHHKNNWSTCVSISLQTPSYRSKLKGQIIAKGRKNETISKMWPRHEWADFMFFWWVVSFLLDLNFVIKSKKLESFRFERKKLGQDEKAKTDLNRFRLKCPIKDILVVLIKHFLFLSLSS